MKKIYLPILLAISCSLIMLIFLLIYYKPPHNGNATQNQPTTQSTTMSVQAQATTELDGANSLLLSEETTNTVKVLQFNSDIESIDPIEYLTDGKIRKVTLSSSSTWISYNAVAISGYVGGKVEFAEEKNLPLVFITTNIWDLDGETNTYATFYYNSALYYFPLFAKQNIDQFSYQWFRIAETIFEKNNTKLNIRKVHLDDNEQKQIPPMEINSNGKKYIMESGFYHSGCYEGGRVVFGFFKNFEIPSCHTMTKTDEITKNFNILHLQPKYPYDLVASQDHNSLYAQIKNTNTKVLVFAMSFLHIDNSSSTMPKEPETYRGCGFDCNDYQNYRFIIGPAGLLYSYHLAK